VLRRSSEGRTETAPSIRGRTGTEQCRPRPLTTIDIHGYNSVYNNNYIKIVTIILTLKQGPSASVPSIPCLIEEVLMYVLYIVPSFISFSARSQDSIHFHLNIFVTAR